MDRHEKRLFGGIVPHQAALPLESDTSLDPRDWNKFRELCSSELEGLIDYLAGTADRPVWQPIPAEVKTSLSEPLPTTPQGAPTICEQIKTSILPYTLGNTHPRFFGWVHGAGTTGGMLAELYAAAINANLGGREHAPVYVERTVIEWCKQIFSFPKSAGGLLLSGTSMANLVALTVARNHHCPVNVRELGVASAPATMVAYTSVESHCSVAKAFELIGLGRQNLRQVPTNHAFQMNLKALQRSVAMDRAAGLQPFCVIGTAGTVNTAAIDNLDRLADFCQHENLWLHIDGAFGSMAILSDEHREKLRGIDRADSLAFDFHKWLHVPYDAGCVLIRDGDIQRDAFSTQANYLSEGRGAAAGAPWFCELGPELSRSFRALKVWFTVKEHGISRLGEKITDNCRQARYLRELIDGHPLMELRAPVNLNIVCFRYVQPGWSDADLDRLNSDIVCALHETGIAVPSTTKINNHLAIRVNITNHRTSTSDLELLIRAIDELAGPITAAISPARQHSLAAPDIISMIQTAAARPELQPLLFGTTVTYNPRLVTPFVIHRDDAIELGPDSVRTPEACVTVLRHAAELAILQRWTHDDSPTSLATIALLACRTAAVGSSLVDVAAAVPDFLTEPYAFFLQKQISAQPLDVVRQLLPLQGFDPAIADDVTPAGWEMVYETLRLSEVLAGPTEHLLTTGGDARLNINRQTGLSRYGCRRQPVEGLASFGSCTATTVTRQNFIVAERWRQELLTAVIRGEFIERFTECSRSIKEQILRLCGGHAIPGAEVLLCSSGTDAELQAVCLATQLTSQKLTNIVIAPDETGTGVPDAAAGRHFSTHTPFGYTVTKGEPLDGFPSERVETRTIDARDSLGNLRSLVEIEAEIVRAVDTAVAQGICLLHVWAAAKTGWRAPSLQLVRGLAARHGDRLIIVVDTCQMRLDCDTLQQCLEDGYLLQITGSKSFGGPPFSGALIVPPALAARFATVDSVPHGICQYAAQTDWPAGWNVTRRQLPQHYNAGLLLRWATALREMQAFDDTPRQLRMAILRELANTVQSILEHTECVVQLPFDDQERALKSTAGDWDGVPTIFPFRVRHRVDGRGGRSFTEEQTKALHRRLNSDLSLVPALQTSGHQRFIASTLCHIGQTVNLCRTPGYTISVLRFCTGANVVSRIVFDASLGSSIEERLEYERRRICLVFEKLELIVEHWDAIDRYEAARKPPAPPVQNSDTVNSSTTINCVH